MGAVNGRLDSKIRNCFSTVAARGVDWIMATCLNADAEALGHDQMHAFQGSLLQPLCWTTTGSTRIDSDLVSYNRGLLENFSEVCGAPPRWCRRP
ncbi:unnamed protein product, partial [Prorocentrum cordatum]